MTLTPPRTINFLFCIFKLSLCNTNLVQNETPLVTLSTTASTATQQVKNPIHRPRHNPRGARAVESRDVHARDAHARVRVRFVALSPTRPSRDVSRASIGVNTTCTDSALATRVRVSRVATAARRGQGAERDRCARGGGPSRVHGTVGDGVGDVLARVRVGEGPHGAVARRGGGETSAHARPGDDRDGG